MIFRIELCVLMAEPEATSDGGLQLTRPWMDAYKVKIGVNAPDICAATSVAARALAGSQDADGARAGGLVIEAHPKLVDRLEFEAHEEYLLQAIDDLGLFYVSGRTHFTIRRSELPRGVQELVDSGELRRNLPIVPTFVFPDLNAELTSRRVRIVCPVCGAWSEFDHAGFMYSFFDGLSEQDEEYWLAHEAATSAAPFIEAHLQCLSAQNESGDGLYFLYEGDNAYAEVDPSKQYGRADDR